MADHGSIVVRIAATVGSRRSAAGRRRPARAWEIEPLEGRVVPAVIMVMNTNDSGTGSLRAAIDQANLDPAQDTIDFAPAVTGTITLSSALPDLSTNIILSGPGAAALTVARSGDAGTPAFGIFTVTAGAEVAISGLTITGGQGGIFKFGMDTTTLGGGIANFGTLTVTNSTISGNSASNLGGGIANLGTLTVTNSTISGNSAGRGGGIENGGTLTVTNSTISGNSADFGGGIDNGAILTYTLPTVSFTLIVTNSTISDNSAGPGGGGIDSLGYPGETVTLTNSLFSGNSGGSLAVDSNAVFSLSHNLFSDAPSVALDPTNLINTDPLLGPLADNGGPTLTQALLPGSPAIDAGAPIPGVTTDQRGISRPQGTAPDIGAFESRGFTLAVAGGDGQSTPTLAPFPGPLVVHVTSPFGEPVAGGRITFAVPTTGASAVLSSNTATIDAGGQAAVTAAANGLGGTYAVTASGNGVNNSVAFTLTNAVIPPPIVPPPTVLALQRFGFHSQPTTLVLTFSTPLDPTRAQDLGNYRLIAPRHHGRVIPLLSARYDPAADAVTLTPARRLSLSDTFLLTVNGTAPDGLISTSGVLLDGSRSGRPGNDFVTRFGLNALAGSSNTAFNKVRYQWAGPGPFGGLQFADPPVATTSVPRGPIVATGATRHRVHRRG